jgi:hypothetical protein
MGLADCPISRENAVSRDDVKRRVYGMARSGYPTPAIVRHVEETEDEPPVRSTIYKWVKAAKGSVDTSGEWRLVRDKSGRPDLALRVWFALEEAWKGEASREYAERDPGARPRDALIQAIKKHPRFTNSDAEWVALVGKALPDPGTDATALVDLLALARGARAAVESGDEVELAVLDSMGGAVHFLGWAEYHRLMNPDEEG